MFWQDVSVEFSFVFRAAALVGSRKVGLPGSLPDENYSRMTLPRQLVDTPSVTHIIQMF